jgi:putative membrane protein
MKTIPFVLALLVAAPALAKGNDASAPSDANIAAIAVAANQIDVDAGNQALTKTSNPEVKQFAQTMVQDHGAVIKKATDLAGKLKLTPEDNDLSRKLKSDAQATADKMKGLSGTAFDKAYVANEVAYHQAVLDALDKVLIPDAKNAELKKLLEQVRPVIAQHLHHAESLDKKLASAK